MSGPVGSLAWVGAGDGPRCLWEGLGSLKERNGAGGLSMPLTRWPRKQNAGASAPRKYGLPKGPPLALLTSRCHSP